MPHPDTVRERWLVIELVGGPLCGARRVLRTAGDPPAEWLEPHPPRDLVPVPGRPDELVEPPPTCVSRRRYRLEPRIRSPGPPTYVLVGLE